MDHQRVFLPGKTIGILGSGQLGRMLAIAARNLGYRIGIFSPDHDTPAGQVADFEIHAEYTDFPQLELFSKRVDVLTYEFENIPEEALIFASQFTTVRPQSRILHVAQHRLREKETLRNLGLPVTPFLKIESLEQLRQASQILGDDIILKTAAFGYDGKGQVRINRHSDLKLAWEKLGATIAVAEKCISFQAECSVIGARGLHGEFSSIGPLRNTHRNHILDETTYPGMFREMIETQARDIIQKIMNHFQMIGLLCVEFFVTEEGVLINEMAPRPHNSGHLTIEGNVTSQFEQMIRAVCGLPLGSFKSRKPSLMINLLGDLWKDKTPDWEKILTLPDVHLHLYGKLEARPGRKMGHITILADTLLEAQAQGVHIKEILGQK